MKSDHTFDNNTESKLIDSSNFKVIDYYEACLNKKQDMVSSIIANEDEIDLTLSENEIYDQYHAWIKQQSLSARKNFHCVCNVLSIKTDNHSYQLIAWRNAVINDREKKIHISKKIQFNTDSDFLDGEEFLLKNSDSNPIETVNKLHRHFVNLHMNVSDREILMLFPTLKNGDLSEIRTLLKNEIKRNDSDKSASDSIKFPAYVFLNGSGYGELSPGSNLLPIDNLINVYQAFAAYKAMHNSLTFVQGPPGTGKTDMIVKIIISMYLSGKKVVVCSQNNKAIDDISEKLDALFWEKNIPIPYFRYGNQALIPLSCENLKKRANYCKNKTIHKNEINTLYDRSIETCRNLNSFLKDNLTSFETNTIGAANTIKETKYTKILNETDFRAVECLLRNKSIYDMHSLIAGDKSNFAKKLINRDDWHNAASDIRTFLSAEEKNVKEFSNAFPVLLSTNQSAMILEKTGSYAYDLMIMDEAAQCNGPNALPVTALSRSLLLCGDQKQLKSVVKLDKNKNEKLIEKYHIPETYNCYSNSFYSSFIQACPSNTPIILKKNYRNVKEICDFFSRNFYDNSILSEKKDHSTLPPFTFININNSTERMAHSSVSEAEVCIKIIHTINNSKFRKKTIGVITPFTDQEDLIEKFIKEPENHIDQNIQCGTVHSFQGAEKDIIIFSSSLTAKTASKTFGWLNKQPELINVAVSRAKYCFIMIGDSNIINNNCLHSSTFYKLYQQCLSFNRNSIFHVESEEVVVPKTVKVDDLIMDFSRRFESALKKVDIRYSVKQNVSPEDIFSDSIPAEFSKQYNFDLVVYIEKKAYLLINIQNYSRISEYDITADSKNKRSAGKYGLHWHRLAESDIESKKTISYLISTYFTFDNEFFMLNSSAGREIFRQGKCKSSRKTNMAGVTFEINESLDFFDQLICDAIYTVHKRRIGEESIDMKDVVSLIYPENTEEKYLRKVRARIRKMSAINLHLDNIEWVCSNGYSNEMIRTYQGKFLNVRLEKNTLKLKKSSLLPLYDVAEERFNILHFPEDMVKRLACTDKNRLLAHRYYLLRLMLWKQEVEVKNGKGNLRIITVDPSRYNQGILGLTGLERQPEKADYVKEISKYLNEAANICQKYSYYKDQLTIQIK